MVQRNHVGRILKYIWQYWRLLPFILVSMTVATLLDLLPPWLTGAVLIDRVIVAQDTSLLIWIVFALIGAILLRQIFDFAQRYFLALLNQRVIHRLRCDLYEHIGSLPMGYFSKTPVGDLVARQVTDAHALEDGLKALVTEAGVHIIRILGILGFMFYLNARLTLLILPFAMVLLVVMHFSRRVVKGASFTVRQHLGHLSTLATETLSGIGVVKAFGMERTELNRFTGLSRNILQANVGLARLEGFYSATVEIILVGTTVTVVWLAAPQVLGGDMSVGALVSYLIFLTRLQNPLKGLSKANFEVQKAMGAAQRIFAVMDTPTERTETPGTIILPPVKGSIRFENMTFGYDPDRPIWKDFSLEVEPGESVALVGPSGVGKTTLINLLLRFYSPDRGEIWIDGYPFSKLDVESVRQQIALVNQEPTLFSTTIRENIQYGKLGATPAEVEQAARAANIHEFIAALPQGYDTPVGQRGLALSGGQRQRIALARAFLKDAPILVLDEATTSVDSEAEALIQEALANLMGGRTTLIIAHRLSSLQHAQRIVVVEDGQISEQGSHRDLIANSGLYRRLHDLQASVEAEPTVGR